MLLNRFDTPPVWMAVALVLVLAFRPAGWWPGPFGLILGLALLGGSIALVVRAQREFRAHGTSAMPGTTPASLVTTGPYRYSRNPIYLAEVGIVAGLALLIASPVGLVVAPGLWFILQERFVKPEEARIAAAFGADWQAYAARTRRWV